LFLEAANITLRILHILGYIARNFVFLFQEHIFNSDVLLIEWYGRIDFWHSDADNFYNYNSVRHKLYSLSDALRVYSAHYYKEHLVPSITQEKNRNPRLSGGIKPDKFRVTMNHLNLLYSKFIDRAISGNQQCGVCPNDLPDNLAAYCRQMAQSLQG